MKHGTYVREPDGGLLLYHSDVRWNDASFALNSYLHGDRVGSLGYWRLVPREEADEVWAFCKLGAGESIEWFGESYDEQCIRN